MRLFRLLTPLLLPLFLGACTTLVAHQLNDKYGQPDPGHFDHLVTAEPGSAPDYWRDVRPILDRRCVTCHACYDAPCQLNLSRYDGMTRGASTEDVYATRLVAADPTRVGVDAQTIRAWREKGFFPVLNERRQTPEANLNAGVLFRLIAGKRQQAAPPAGPLDDPDIDLTLNRSQTCTRVEGVEDYLHQHPTRGMPFALPALNDAEFATLSGWLAAGAPYHPPLPLPTVVQAQVDQWEQFLNADPLKNQLTARYIYEHWFIGHLWFAEMPGQYFELVRSRTPPGKPISRIATRRPYDDPGVARVYYRLQRLEATPVAKTHMPLQLNAERLAHLKSLFIDADYTVSTLTSYAPDIASNPFITFRELPLNARYRLMLEEAQFTLMGYMKGPVCRGQVALNSIDDQFWVFFVAPTDKEVTWMQKLVEEATPTLRLPAENDSPTGLVAWRQYAEMERQYLENKSNLVEHLGSKGVSPTLDDLWDGDGHNPNAALTVFRHFDSASVSKGLVGKRPQTAFVMGYPLMERMHYLLTAGFDVFGNVSHQLSTRLYMDFLRMESELNFLAFLPIKDRQSVLNHWYRNRSEPHNRYFADASAHFPQETGVRYQSNDHLNELYELLKQRLAPVSEKQHTLAASKLDTVSLQLLQRLERVQGIPASILPEASLLLIRQADDQLITFSILRNSAHSNVAELFNEEDRRLPKEDTLVIQHGVLGAYPNALFVLDQRQLSDFVSTVERLKGEADLRQLADRFALRRTHPLFWAYSDRLHEDYRATDPVDFGILDYSRLENF